MCCTTHCDWVMWKLMFMSFHHGDLFFHTVAKTSWLFSYFFSHPPHLGSRKELMGLVYWCLYISALVYRASLLQVKLFGRKIFQKTEFTENYRKLVLWCSFTVLNRYLNDFCKIRVCIQDFHKYLRRSALQQLLVVNCCWKALPFRCLRESCYACAYLTHI